MRQKGARPAPQVMTSDTEINSIGLDRFDGHNFRFLAYNAAGDSTASNDVTVVL